MPFQSFNRLICSSINTSRKVSSIPAEKFASYSVSSCHIYVLPAKEETCEGEILHNYFLSLTFWPFYIAYLLPFVKRTKKDIAAAG